MGSPFYPSRSQVAVKVEGTEGTDATPAAADVIQPVYDVSYEPAVEMFARDAVDVSFSRFSQIAGERSGTITFSTELKGSGAAGTAPPQLSAPMQAAGFGETIVGGTSVDYDPVSESIPSATVVLQEGSADTVVKRRKLVGARGNLTMTCTKGQAVMMTFAFVGRYIEPDETTALTSAAFTPNPLPFLSAAFTFQGTSVKIQTFSLDMGNAMALRNDANQASGNFSAAITGRAPTGSVDPEREDIATHNVFSIWTGNTEGVVSFTLTGSAGNISAFSAPKAQITGITEGDRDGIRVEALDLAFNKSTAAGDDEVNYQFT